MKEKNKKSKKPSDNNTTRNSSYIKNDNIKSTRKSSKYNSTSEAPLKLNHSNTNNSSFYDSLNIYLENVNNNQEEYDNIQNLSKSKDVKEFSFDNLNTSEFDDSEITIEHISTPVKKNIIKKGNILMKIENNNNNKIISVLPNIVELAEEDLISINSKDTNKTAIVSNNYNNYDTKNAFYKAKNVINESNEQFKIYSFIKNNYETSIKKNKDKYVKLTPIKKNRIKKNINNNNNIYNTLELNTHKKIKLRESNIKQINKKLIFEEKNKMNNNINISISSSPKSESEKEQLFFDKSINYSDINDEDNQNNSYIIKNINDISSETDNNSLKTLIKKEDRNKFIYIHNDNYDTDFSNYTLNKGNLNLNLFDYDKNKKDFFLNNTLEKKNKNKNKNLDKICFNYNTYNNNVENINKIKIRKNQYRKYKYRAKNNKIIIDDNINDSIDKKRNNDKNFEKKDYITNFKNYYNYNLYENLLNTDKLTSIRFTQNELSQLELDIESFKEKRIIIFSILCSLCEKFKYKRETFHLTISLIDGYLYNLINNKNSNISYRLTDINDNSLVLISLSCLLICSKIEEKKYIKPISFIRALYENEYMLKYFQNNINSIKIEKIFFFEQKIMILLKWKIFYVNINTWLNWYICQWDLYVDSVDFVKKEIIKNYGESNIFYFKKNNEQSYYNYRIINQLIKLIKFDLNSILYDNKLLVMCTIFICIEYFYNKINKSNKTYIILFNNFIKFNINENIINDDNFINTLKYCKELEYGFLENNLYNFDLPIFYQTNNIQDNHQNNNNQSYEDFLSFQTFNQNIAVYLNQRIQKNIFTKLYNNTIYI